MVNIITETICSL